MFFLLSKIFALILFPYPILLFSATGALILLPAGYYKKFFGSILIFTILLSTPLGTYITFTSLEEKYPSLEISQIPISEAVIVLSGMLNPVSRKGRLEFGEAVDRIHAGAKIIRSKKARYILLSGGSGFLSNGIDSEAVLLKDWLVEQNINPDQILVEGESRNTGENAANSAAILRSKNIDSVILVTSAFHMHRGVLTLRKQGIKVIPFPVDFKTLKNYYGPEYYFPSLERLYLSTLGIKEYAGILAYAVSGYL